MPAQTKYPHPHPPTHTHAHAHTHTHALAHTHAHTPLCALVVRRIVGRLALSCTDLFLNFRSRTIFTSDQIFGFLTSSRKTFIFLVAIARFVLSTSRAGSPLAKNLIAGNLRISPQEMEFPKYATLRTKTKCGPAKGSLWLREFAATPRFHPTLPVNKTSQVSPETDHTIPGAARWVPLSIPARTNTHTRVKIKCGTQVDIKYEQPTIVGTNRFKDFVAVSPQRGAASLQTHAPVRMLYYFRRMFFVIEARTGLFVRDRLL